MTTSTNKSHNSGKNPIGKRPDPTPDLPPAADVISDNDTAFDQPREHGSRKIDQQSRSYIPVMTAHFPIMSKAAWWVLLSVTLPTRHGAGWNMFEQLLRQDAQSFYLSKILGRYSKKDRLAFGLNRLTELTPAELFFVSLVANPFWASFDNDVCDLRNILSRVSHRPKECLFSDDPAPEDLGA